MEKITKLKQFTNIASRVITTKNRLIPVQVEFDKETQEYKIEEQKVINYQKDHQSDDQTLDDKYNDLKPAIDAYHKWYMEKKLLDFITMSENDVVSIGQNQTMAKREFMDQVYKLIDKPITEKIEDEECKSIHKFLSCYLKQGSETFFNKQIEFKNLCESKFINPDLKKEKNGELKLFLEDANSITYFNNDVEYTKAIAVLTGYDSKMFSNCHGLLKARMQMYESDGKSASIPYRCIAHNVARFRKSRSVFNKAIESKAFNIAKLNKDFHDQLVDLSELSGKEVDSVMSIFDKELYVCYMTHKGITILNTIIGRDSKRGSEKEGLNQYINKYNQSIKSTPKSDEDKGKKKPLPMLDQLHDLILYGDKVFIPQLNDFTEVKPLIKNTVDALQKLGVFEGHTEINSLANLLDSLLSYDDERLKHIYLNSKTVRRISNLLYGDWSVLDAIVPRKNKKKQPFISIQAINESVERMEVDDYIPVQDYFKQSKVNSIEKENETEDVFEMLKRYYADFCASRILQQRCLSQEQIEKTGLLMDAIKRLSVFVSTFSIGNTMDDSDGLFYKEYNKFSEVLREFDGNYDLIRNFFYKKPFNTDKLRLHFGIGEELLHGWPEQDRKGTNGHAYLFRMKHTHDDEYDFYLGIGTVSMFSGKKDGREDIAAFKQQLLDKNDLCPLERYFYYQIDGKTFGGQNYISANGDVVAKKDKELVDYIIESIKSQGNDTINDEYTKYKSKVDSSDKEKVTQDALMSLIKENDANLYGLLKENVKFNMLYNAMLDRWKKAFGQVSQIREAQKFSAKKYKDYEEVKNDMKIITSKRIIEYIPVSWKELSDALKPIKRKNGKVEPQKFYLFRITNKDFSYADTMRKGMRESRGNENLHTMYFRAMMNENQDTFDIGTGDIFFRKATDAKKLKRTPTHKKNEEGKVIVSCKSSEKLGQLREMKCELIKDKHHTEDHYEFHLSMTQNYKPNKIQEVFTKGVVEYLKYNNSGHAELEDKEDTHIIGIDRGERNLLYVTMIDMEGNIKLQKSLNEIVSKGVSPNGEPFEAHVDYQKLSMTRAKEMRNNQKRYGIPLKMKEIKEGHLALAVHEIANLMIDNHAILVMEELSEGFMRSRQSQLANLYQQFENKLISKLQFCVKDKKLDSDAPGGLYKAYQLVGKKNKRNRNGFIFYVPAWMTSKIDPVTGFVNIFCFNYKNENSSAEFFNAFKSISRNTQTGEYEFVFRYEDFKDLKVLQNVTTPNVEWCITSYGKRIERVKETNGYKYVEIDNLTEQFDELFSKFNIDTDADIKEQVVSMNSRPLYIGLIRLLKLTLQMRNSGMIDKKEYDYIISPVADPITRTHFDSTKFDDLDREDKEHNDKPVDADANGAYNIARKGLIAVRQLINGSNNFKIENKEWLEEAQKNMPKYTE